MTEPVLKEFMWAMERSISEAARCSDDTSVIKDQCIFEQEGDQEFKEERDNTIYNMGVKDGIARFADHLQEKNYTILDPQGNVVRTEPVVDEVPALSFSQTYFETQWSQVSS